MANNAKIKPQVKRLLCFMKRGYGRGYRVNRSKWSGFVVEALPNPLQMEENGQF